ncbi:MAG: carboxypeptidase-like regulatory domain-containing protein [Ignavibacteriaceae bacterium]
MVQTTVAQGTGSLRGTVTDKSTKEELPGANVIIRGTSIGAATDLDGNFVLRNIPSGPQILVVSYIGYIADTIQINISAGRTLEQNFGLSSTIVEGEEVLVTAQAIGQLQAINQQLSSDKISSVVSESRIQELPDFNAAQTISRLPGISTLQSSGEANKIVIRGLAPQYNSVEIEGFKLASTGSTTIGAISQATNNDPSTSISNDRSVDISMISPYMLKTVSVFKSLTPDLNANSIGGTVNMELREAPPELHLDVLWQSGYTQKSGTYGNYRGVASISKRFFDDNLGVYLLGNIESYDRDADNMTSVYIIPSSEVGSNGYRPVQVRSVQQVRHFETRERYGGNLILDYKLPAGAIKSINMFTRLSSDYEDYRQFLDYRVGDINFNYRSGVNDIDAAINSIQFEYDFDFLQMDLKFANTYSFNSLPNSPYIQFFQNGGISVPVPENTIPDNLTNHQRYEAGGGGAASTFLSTVNLYSTRYKENNQSYKSDLKFPLQIGSDVTGYFKIGGQYDNQYHINDQETPYSDLRGGNDFTDFMMDSLASRFNLQLPGSRFPATNFTSTDGDLLDSFLDDRFGRIYWMPNPTIPLEMVDFISSTPEFVGVGGGQNPGGWFHGPYQALANDYRYSEKYYAGYLMSEVNFLDFMIVGGVRYEKVNSEYEVYNMVDARNPVTQTIDTVKSTPENEFWLPMVQIRYKPFDWIDIRYAYTNTLARPDYHQLSPRITMDYTLNNVWAGNPELVTAKAFNHDLIISFHSNELGLLTVGGFYKTIENFSYYTQYTLHPNAPAGIKTTNDFEILGARPKDGALIYTYLNSPYDAIVKGVELDLQTRLWYLPFPLNGVVLGINYTHMSSEAKYPFRNDRSYANPNPPPRNIVEVFDSVRTGRLVYQPDDILNSYVGFDYGDFSCRVSFVFQGNSVSYVGAFPEQDGFTRDYFRMDASARQILPWYGVEIYLDVFNINAERNTSAQQSIGGFTNEQNYGLTANLGVRFKL